MTLIIPNDSLFVEATMLQTGELEVLLIRHGESENNQGAKHIGGRCVNTPLTEKGRRQAQLLGLFLSATNSHVDQVWQAPTIRTRDTCLLTLRAMRLKSAFARVSKLLLEYDAGAYEGKLRSRIYNHPAIQAKMLSEGRNYRPPNGESQIDVRDRWRTWARECYPIRRHARPKRVLVFTHGIFIRCVLMDILDFAGTRSVYPLLDVENTSVTTIRRGADGTWKVMSLNVTAHLQAEHLLIK